MRRKPQTNSDVSSPQVYVLDDDVMLLRCVVRQLERAGYQVAGFSCPQTFLREARLIPPCCVLLDVHMPEVTGPEVQELLAHRDSPPAIVFMSGVADVPTSVKVMKAGAVDFLPKPFGNADLLAAVGLALQRNTESAAARERLLAARRLLARLTPREREVCDCVVRGLRSKEIAEELGAAVKTVNIHRSRMMAKLGVASVAELVKLTLRAGGAAPDL